MWLIVVISVLFSVVTFWLFKKKKWLYLFLNIPLFKLFLIDVV